MPFLQPNSQCVRVCSFVHSFTLRDYCVKPGKKSKLFSKYAMFACQANYLTAKIIPEY